MVSGRFEIYGKNTIETVEKSLTDMFIRLVRIYPCLIHLQFLSNIFCIDDIRKYICSDQHHDQPALVRRNVWIEPTCISSQYGRFYIIIIFPHKKSTI